MTDELSALRAQIDAIDDKLFALLCERLAVVARVGEYKRNKMPGICPIRPGREATMLKDIARRFKKTDFSPAAAAALWRIIIGTSTALEAKLIISVYATKADRDLFWIAREYFGPAAEIVMQPHIKRVIGDVMDGKASVGVVPTPTGHDSSFWWTNLMQNTPNAPKIFAHLPYVTHGEKLPQALAFARLAPEPSGDDISLYVLEVNHDVSQSKLQNALLKEKLEPNWVSVATLSPNLRHHLIEVKGFVPPEHMDMKRALDNLGSDAVRHSYFLGSYAVPFSIAGSNHD